MDGEEQFGNPAAPAPAIGVGLNNIRRLLRPGGLLLVLEGTQPNRWGDLTFGLSEGWWRCRDTQLRRDYPLIGSSDWLNVLSDRGFVDP